MDNEDDSPARTIVMDNGAGMTDGRDCGHNAAQNCNCSKFSAFPAEERVFPATTISVPIQPISINPRQGRIDTFDRVALHNKNRDAAIIAALQGILSELNKIRTEGIMVKK